MVGPNLSNMSKKMAERGTQEFKEKGKQRKMMMLCVCVCGECVFVKRANRGYTYTQYTSTGDVPAIGDIPNLK